MSSMKEELLKVIEANLPAEVGKTLQKRLEQADSDAQEIKELRLKNKKLEEDIDEAIKDKANAQASLDEIFNLQTDICHREKAVKEREIELDKFTAELKQTEAEKRADMLTEMVGLVFRSPVYKRHYSEGRNLRTDYVGQDNQITETGKDIQEEITEE